MPATCKYFLQGNCRFGDSCRYYHPEEVQDDENYDDEPQYDQRPQKQQRFPQQAARIGGYDQRQSNYQDRQQTQRGSFDDRTTPGRRSSNASTDGGYENKYKWVSPLHRAPTEQQQSRQQASYQPLSVAVSGQHRPLSQTSSIPSQSHNLEDYADMIANDMQMWMESLWVFSSYGFANGKPSAFGFPDYSFEELRAEALEAQRTGTMKEYRQKLADLERSYNTLQDKLMNLDDRGYDHLLQGIDAHIKMNPEFGGKVDFGPELAFRWPSGRAKLPSGSRQQPQPQPQSASASRGPGGFSFAMPKKQEIPAEFYTPIDQLTEDEKAAFQASIFQFGSVPLQPPAVELCK